MPKFNKNCQSLYTILILLKTSINPSVLLTQFSWKYNSNYSYIFQKRVIKNSFGYLFPLRGNIMPSSYQVLDKQLLIKVYSDPDKLSTITSSHLFLFLLSGFLYQHILFEYKAMLPPNSTMLKFHLHKENT